MLPFTSCGSGTPAHQPATGTSVTTGSAVAERPPPALPSADGAGGERSPLVRGGANPPVPGQPAPSTRQELIASEGTAPFEWYLAGPWARNPGSDADASDRQGLEIIHFEPGQRHITFFDGEVQEIFSWDASELRTAARITIQMHNAHVTSVQKTIVAEVVADDELELTVWSSDSDDESDQNGTYRRLNESARNKLVHTGAPQPGMAALELSGLYRGSDGQTIHFDPPRFTWQQHDRRLSGGFAVYSAGQRVIVFKAVSTAGATSGIRTYAVEFREHRGAERVRRSLVLYPATLEITGLADVGTTALHFEQVEMIDPAGDDGAEAGTPPPPADRG